MARRTVRIKIPTGKPDELLDLMDAALAEHVELGAGSPIDHVDMTSFGTRVADARQKRDQAADLEAQAEALNGQAATILGIAQGQTRQTEGTLLSDLLKIRDLLKVRNRGNEQNLELWGFDVVIGTASSPSPPPPQSPPSPPPPSPPSP